MCIYKNRIRPELKDEPMETPQISVCICTFRRPCVRQTIESIARQSLDPEVRFEIVVVDNDFEPSARSVVEATHADFDHLDLTYVHAPAQNISIARNACLNTARGEWVAFIDDDEIASEDWLKNHVATAEKGGHDIYVGPVIAAYPDDAPNWAVEADMHTVRGDDRRPIMTGHTGNVFFKREHPSIKDVRFSEERGRTGGEDTEFFHTCFQRGAKIEHSEHAFVFEPVPHHRLSVEWMAKHKFRSGITYGKVIQYQSGFAGNLLKLIASGAKSACLYVLSCLQFKSVGESRRNYLRAVFHAGVVAAFFSVREAEYYGDVTPVPTDLSKNGS